MQDPQLIPTPLIEVKERPLTVEASPPDPFPLFRIAGFLLTTGLLWWKTTIQLLLFRRATSETGARRIREFLERMGGVWIKAGQIVALRRDVFLPETCDELSKLQDTAHAFPWEDAKAILERDLGRPVEETFSEFDPVPIAAASIGQTHRARLRESGVVVAVKIQRPSIRDVFKRDLRYIKLIAWLLKRFRIARQAHWDEVLWELQSAFSDELDYRLEASSIRRMGKHLARHKVYAPEVFPKYCSPRVLVMEFIEGVFMSDYIKVATTDPAKLGRWLAENNIIPKKLGERLLLSHMRQVFEDNIYHADLHPGNIVLQRDSRFALIDFGSIGTFERTMLKKYQRVYEALAERDFARATDQLLLLGPPLPNTDILSLKGEMVRLFRQWSARTAIKELPYHEKSFAAFFNSSLSLFPKYGVQAEWGFLRLNRSDITLDASLMFLLPDINYLKICTKYLRQAQRRRATRAGQVDQIQRVAAGIASLSELPEQLKETFDLNIEWMRKRATQFDGRVTKFAYFANSLVSLAWWCTLAFGSVFVLSRESPAFREWTETLFHVTPSPKRAVALTIVVAMILHKLGGARRYLEVKDYDERYGRQG